MSEWTGRRSCPVAKCGCRWLDCQHTITDLFDEIERLRAELEDCRDRLWHVIEMSEG